MKCNRDSDIEILRQGCKIRSPNCYSRRFIFSFYGIRTIDMIRENRMLVRVIVFVIWIRVLAVWISKLNFEIQRGRRIVFYPITPSLSWEVGYMNLLEWPLICHVPFRVRTALDIDWGRWRRSHSGRRGIIGCTLWIAQHDSGQHLNKKSRRSSSLACKYTSRKYAVLRENGSRVHLMMLSGVVQVQSHIGRDVF